MLIHTMYKDNKDNKNIIDIFSFAKKQQSLFFYYKSFNAYS